jgi:2-polyprenyl-6-methoxyphenol hydroxylase-like FAD-dependent oxidoreductase
MPISGRHALVIGGSMAGLCAARALSERFDRVTLVERDVFGGPDPRKGVPQGRHLHALLRRGLDELEGWFPGLNAELQGLGAEEMEFGTDLRWFHYGGWKVGAPSGVVCLGLSRPLLEHAVRQRVLALPNLDRQDGVVVRGLLTDPARRRVTGVRVTKDGVESEIAADLVVDTSGRGSALPRWLAELGRDAVPESVLTVNVGYASRVWRRPPAGTVAWKGCYVLGQSPHSKRLGAIFPVEGGRWISVLAGVLGDHPPIDEEGHARFARELPHPAIADALARAEPLSDIASYRFPAHQRRHYERASMPDGLVAVGDAVCSFNPIYGQGITTAALGARALEAHLATDGGGEGASDRFQRRLSGVLDVPWMMSTGEDLRYPEVEAVRPWYNGIAQWYTARVHRAALHDPEVARAFYQAMNLVAPPTVLAGVAWRVLMGGGERPAAPQLTQQELATK